MSLLDDEHINNDEFYVGILKKIPNHQQPIHLQVWYDIVSLSISKIIDDNDYEEFINLINMFYQASPEVYIFKSHDCYYYEDVGDVYKKVLIVLDWAVEENRSKFEDPNMLDMLARCMSGSSVIYKDLMDGKFRQNYNMGRLKNTYGGIMKIVDREVVENNYQEIYNMVQQWINYRADK